MPISSDYEVEGQMSLFDMPDRDSGVGKMSPVRSRQERQEEKISAPSSKKSQGSSSRKPLYLDLRKASGATPEWSIWNTDKSHGESLMHSTKSHSEEDEYTLSQILEEDMGGARLQKYSLSPRACLGILKRSQRRGKELPFLLESVLAKQAGLSEVEYAWAKTLWKLQDSGMQKDFLEKILV